MKRSSLAITILITACLMLLSPDLVKAEWHTQSRLGLHLSQKKSDLSFSTRYFPEYSLKDDDLNAVSSFERVPGYWFLGFPWLGLALEATVLQTFEENEESMESSAGADTDLDFLSSFILFRYRNWRLEPFVGIGPTFIFSDFGSKKPNLLNHMFLGVYYSF